MPPDSSSSTPRSVAARKQVECAFCGERTRTTTYDVPPRFFNFGPAMLMIRGVPACAACLDGVRDEDVHFREEVLRHPVLEIEPSTESPVAKMLRQQPTSDIRQYLPSVRAFTPFIANNRPELERTALRYALGMHRAEFGKRMRTEMPARIRLGPDEVLADAGSFNAGWRGAQAGCVQDQVLEYWVRYDEATTASAWLFLFYDAYPVVVEFGSFIQTAETPSRSRAP